MASEIPTNNNQLANGAGYITSSGSCIYAERLRSSDKRYSYPNSVIPNYSEAAITFSQYNTLGISHDYGDYYDVFAISSYADSSGGNENALIFGKNGDSVFHSRFSCKSDNSWGTPYLFLDSNNYSSYALPLSGGTLTGDLNFKTTSRYISVWNGDLYLANNASNGLVLLESTMPAPLYRKSGNNYTIWHEGNDGSGSGMDADLLDGQHASYFINTSNIGNQSVSYSNRAGYVDRTDTGNWDANNPGENQYLWFYGQGGGVSNFPSSVVGYYGSVVTFFSGGVNYSLHGQLAWGINHDSSNVSVGIAWRAKNNIGWDANWHRLYDDNFHPKADALSISRTIWGQSFDGTGNVDGNLTITDGAAGVQLGHDSATEYLLLDSGQSGIIGSGTDYAVFEINKSTLATGILYPGTLSFVKLSNYPNPSFIIDNSGNIGISTTSPRAKLDVGGYDSSVIIGNTNGNHGVSTARKLRLGLATVGHSGSQYWAFCVDDTTGNSYLQIAYTESDTGLSLRHDGYLGIGTTSPSYKLHVVGDTYTSGYSRSENGFIKGNSSDSYVLLGGGGHKLESSLSVSYANSAGSVRYMSCPDTRETMPAPSEYQASTTGVSFDFKQASVTGLSSYAGIMTFRPYASGGDWSGGYAHQLGFCADNRLYHRIGGNGWATWNKIAYISDFVNLTNSEIDNIIT